MKIYKEKFYYCSRCTSLFRNYEDEKRCGMCNKTDKARVEYIELTEEELEASYNFNNLFSGKDIEKE